MAHLIDKDAVIAEMHKIWDYADEHWDVEHVTGARRFADKLDDAINSLEVKEVDLEKEIDKFYGMYRDKNGVTHDMKDNEICFDWKEDGNYLFIIEFAKHFFELGLKAKQG